MKVKDTRQCAHKPQLLKGKESRSGRQANYRAVAQYKFNSPVTPRATANGFELVNHWPAVTSQAPVHHTSSQRGKNDVTHDRSRVRTDTRKPHPWSCTWYDAWGSTKIPFVLRVKDVGQRFSSVTVSVFRARELYRHVTVEVDVMGSSSLTAPSLRT